MDISGLFRSGKEFLAAANISYKNEPKSSQEIDLKEWQRNVVHFAISSGNEVIFDQTIMMNEL